MATPVLRGETIYFAPLQVTSYYEAGVNGIAPFSNSSHSSLVWWWSGDNFGSPSQYTNSVAPSPSSYDTQGFILNVDTGELTVPLTASAGIYTFIVRLFSNPAKAGKYFYGYVEIEVQADVFSGRWESGLFYQQLPQKWSNNPTSALHLKGLCSLLGRGLDTIEKSIEETKNYPFLQNQFYMEAFLEHLGYENLPDYFTTEDLRLFSPRLLECHRLKGNKVPLNVLTEFIFKDAPDGFHYVVKPPDTNNNLYVVISMPDVDESAIADFTEYIGRKLRGLLYVLVRFVPFWLNLKILIEYSFIENFGYQFNDTNWFFEIDSVNENFTYPFWSEDVPDIEIYYETRQAVSTTAVSSQTLNHNNLNGFKFNNNEEQIGLFSDDDFEVEFI